MTNSAEAHYVSPWVSKASPKLYQVHRPPIQFPCGVLYSWTYPILRYLIIVESFFHCSLKEDPSSTMKSIAFTLLVVGAYSFPWVADQPGVHSPWAKHRKLHTRQQPGSGPGSAATCPFNANHKPAAPITDKYPYNGAKNGQPGKGKGGYQVPANVSLNLIALTYSPAC